MRKLLAACVCLALLGCSTVAHRISTGPSLELPGAVSLPSPALLDSLTPRATSGTLTGPERIIKVRGDELTTWHPSRNATPDVVNYTVDLPGSTSELNFALYQVANFAFAPGDTLEAINLEATYGGALDAADGLYLALADYTSGRWVFHKVDRLSRWMDVSDLGFVGHVDKHSYIALINYSANPATLSNIYLRFSKSTDLQDDEWLYFAEAVDPLASTPEEVTNIARVLHDGTGYELIHAGSLTAPYISYRDPCVTNTPTGMRLRYTLAIEGAPSEAWDSALDDGTSGFAYATDLVNSVIAAPSSPDGNVSVWTQFMPMGPGVSWDHYRLYLRNEMTADEGPISFVHADVSHPIWDLRIGNDNYNLLTTLGSLGDSYLVAYWDDPPTMEERAPGLFYTREPSETDAMYPAILRMIRHTGWFYSDYIMFSGRGRDGGTRFSMYTFAPGAIPGDGFDNIQRWINDGSADVLASSASPDGTKLAFVKQPVGSTLGTLYVRRTLEAGAPQVAVVENVVGRISWYEPTP